MKIGILALQGAFIEHEEIVRKLGATVIEIRQLSDLEEDIDGIILPGGESTAQGKLLKELGLLQVLKEKIKSGLPVMGVCAGLILLAEKLSNDTKQHLGTLPIKVKRNACGRQLGSFSSQSIVKDIGTVPMTFIRAPYIEEVAPNVEVLAKVDEKIVGVRFQNQIGLSFHPELTNSFKVHHYFIELCKKNSLKNL
ncbi:pyridoxal 5'-phosphate synthase glutaminase subunit PdxT [Streptococcus henryi]|uniref:pyridoxal 5'-phosphate synthase glutaminase subunit PdxT n=1 Tax=Streptococcus henryi TaxID=439219 RepID=UPI0003615877|nr:pyridoxal 5'-phosphate synthase glutaminase subunit PdxT [Streptococcus henryi]